MRLELSETIMEYVRLLMLTAILTILSTGYAIVVILVSSLLMVVVQNQYLHQVATDLILMVLVLFVVQVVIYLMVFVLI